MCVCVEEGSFLIDNNPGLRIPNALFHWAIHSWCRWHCVSAQLICMVHLLLYSWASFYCGIVLHKNSVKNSIKQAYYHYFGWGGGLAVGLPCRSVGDRKPFGKLKVAKGCFYTFQPTSLHILPAVNYRNLYHSKKIQTLEAQRLKVAKVILYFNE